MLSALVTGQSVPGYASALLWPRQPEPTPSMWQLWLWRKTLLCAFSADSFPYSLRTPLGCWTQVDRTCWTHCFHLASKTLYSRTVLDSDNSAPCFSVHPALPSRSSVNVQCLCSFNEVTEYLPDTVLPVTVSSISSTYYNFRTRSQLLPPPDPVILHSLSDSLHFLSSASCMSLTLLISSQCL